MFIRFDFSWFLLFVGCNSCILHIRCLLYKLILHNTRILHMLSKEFIQLDERCTEYSTEDIEDREVYK